MTRFATFIFSGILFLTVSCEKCKRCSYTYDVTTIVQGVNGEEEVKSTITGTLFEEDGSTFGDECIKKEESFTIDQVYQSKKDTTVLDNFDFTCADV
ncbi:MAG: hypothetical protein ACI857_001109 [Arenicella sp.]|jgi:hypothetical protein